MPSRLTLMRVRYLNIYHYLTTKHMTLTFQSSLPVKTSFYQGRILQSSKDKTPVSLNDFFIFQKHICLVSCCSHFFPQTCVIVSVFIYVQAITLVHSIPSFKKQSEARRCLLREICFWQFRGHSRKVAIKLFPISIPCVSSDSDEVLCFAENVNGFTQKIRRT